MRKLISVVGVSLAVMSSVAYAGNENNQSSNGNTPYVYKSDYAADKATQSNIDANQNTAINNKVSKTDFNADQDRQDAALATEVQDRQSGDQALNERIDSKSAEFAADQQRQDEALSQEVSDRQSADQGLSDRIDTKVDQAVYDGDKATQTAKDEDQDVKIAGAQSTADTAVSKADNAQSSADNAQTTANSAVGKANQAQTTADLGVSKANAAQTTANNAEYKADFALKGVDSANQYIQDTRDSLDKTNKSVAQNTRDIANHEQRIGNLESQMNNGFSNLRNQIDKVEKKSNAAVAGVAAMANIPQVTEYQSFSVGAGLGYRSDESAVAVGASARLSQNTVGKLSVAADTQHGYTVGAGISYGW